MRRWGDVCWLDELPIEHGAFYIMDRGYIDFRRLRRIAEAGAFLVIRDRSDVRYYAAESRRVDRTINLRSDQSIRLSGTDAPKHWLGRFTRLPNERNPPPQNQITHPYFYESRVGHFLTGAIGSNLRGR